MNKLWIAALLTVIAGCNGKKIRPLKTGLEGTPIPEFVLLRADSSGYINTASIAKGKPAVMFYYSPGCPYCEAQMTDIIDKMDELRDIQFCIFTSAPYAEMKGFFDKFKLGKYSNIMAGVDTGFYFAQHFSAAGVPYTAVYGKDHKLSHAFLGSLNSRQIKVAAKQ